MRRGHGERLPVPSLQDLNEVSAAGHEVVACSALRYGPRSVKSIACHSGDIATVCLDEHAAFCLFEWREAVWTANVRDTRPSNRTYGQPAIQFHSRFFVP